MSRRYDDPVEVRRRDDDPAEFLWRGRFYAVREVLARWVETGAWWQRPEAVAPTDQPGQARQPGQADQAPAATATLTGEREIWRVEASAGRSTGSGVYDLCFDWTAGGWTLLSAQD
jgi:Family of unknown function (DUF6504)